jgi:hypothetical protein
VGPAACGVENVAWRTSFKHRAPIGLRDAGIRIVDGYWRAADPMPGVIFYAVEPIRRLIRRGLSGASSDTTTTSFNSTRKSPLGG